MMAWVSVPPVSIQLSGGYLNRKPKVEFVKVSQSLVGDVGVAVTASVGGTTEVGVNVGTADSTGVGVSPGNSGVEEGTSVATGVGVGEGVFSKITRLAPTNGSSVRTLSPLETRALQSTAL